MSNKTGKDNSRLSAGGDAFWKRGDFHARLLEMVGQAVMVTDPNGVIIYWNQQAEKLYGWNQKEALGRPLRQTIVADGEDRAQEIAAAFAEGESWEGELPVRRKDGSVFTAWVSYQPVLDKNGSLVGYVGLSSDITARISLEQKLASNLRLIETLFNTIPNPVFYKDAEGRYQRCNPSFARQVLGLPAEKIEGKSLFDLPEAIPPELAEVYHEQDQSLLKKGGVQRYEHEVRLADGSRGEFELSKAVVTDDRGRAQGIVGVMSDISAHKRTQAELKQGERRLRLLIQNMPVLVVALDEQGGFLLWNTECEKLTGYEPAEIVGNPRAWELLYPDPGDRKRVCDGFFRQNRDFWDREWDITSKGGAKRTVAWSSLSRKVPIPGWRTWAVGVDVTQRVKAQDALIEAAQQLHQTLESISDGFLTLDENFEVIYFNRAAGELLGRDPRDVIGRNLFEAFPLAKDSIFEEQYTKALREKTNLAFETLFGKAPSDIWYQVRIYPRDSGISVYFQIITERKKAEEALKKSEERYRTIIETAYEGVWEIDSQARTTLVNRRMADMLGYEPDEMIGRPLFDFMDQQMAVQAAQNLNGRRRGRTEKHEIRFRRKDDTDIWTLVSASPRRGPDGEFAGAVSMVADINELKNAERELTDSRRLLAEAQRIARMGSFELLLPSGELKVSDELIALAGGRPGEVEPDQDWLVSRLPEDDPDGSRATLQAALEQGRSYDREHRFTRLDGGEVTVHTVIQAFFNPQGEPAGLRGIVQDISERKKAEDERERLEAQLRQAQKMESLGTLAGGIAHDFNNILGVILGYGELALDMAASSEDNILEVEQIIQAAHRARKLVRQILTFSRKMESRLQPLMLNEQVEQAADILRSTLPKMIRIKLTLEPDLPLVSGDPSQIEQIILNLGANAKDAMPEGGVLSLVTARVRLDEQFTRKNPEIEAGEYVLLTVSDTGQGMDEETARQIFDPFFTTKEVGKGTGLGLSTVFGMIKNHGGHIHCHTRPGQGAVFSIYLPALEMATSAGRSPRAKASEAGGGGETILVVDDESGLRKLARRTLEKYGYRVITAENGERALDIYREAGPSIDLVLMDLSMPGMGGVRCLQELRRQDSGVRVVVASGYMQTQKVDQVMELGAVGFVGKPYAKQELLDTLRKALDWD